MRRDSFSRSLFRKKHQQKKHVLNMARGGVSTEFQVSFVFSLVVVETHKHINIYDIRAIIGTTLPQMHLKNREGKKSFFRYS